MRRLTVKFIALQIGGFTTLLLVLSLVFASVSADRGIAGDGANLVAFWRTVFARPTDGVLDEKLGVDPAVAALGKRLFFDKRLSGDLKRSCASCHVPERGFADGLVKARGRDGKPLLRNTPSLLNVGFSKSFNWDGSAASLEEQAVGPIEDARELGGAFAQIRQRVLDDQALSRVFAETFAGVADGEAVSRAAILSALAAYVRTIRSPRTRFDTWADGDDDALSLNEKKGFGIFIGKGGCVACHSGWRFTDDGFHDIGLATLSRTPGPVQAGQRGVMAFKTPSLRALGQTAPYMHDGSIATIEDVVAHYNRGIVRRKGLAEFLKEPLELSAEEEANLVAFLKTL